MRRRDFLKNTGAASLVVPLSLNGLKLSAIPHVPLLNAVDPANDRVLVIVQLLGGNDGLNTFVPIDQYANLHRARPNVILPLNTLLPLTPTVGLHPAMTGLKNIFDGGKVEIVQSVGYPNQNRSHFRSVDIWRTGADATHILTTGWAGRYFDMLYPGYPAGYPNPTEPNPIAVATGSFVSETCQGRLANYSLALNDPFNFSQVHTGSAAIPPEGNYGRELSFMRDAIKDSNAYASSIAGAATLGKNTVPYPDTDLAHQLKNVVLMISGGMKTKVYVVTQDFFDTHANQVTKGNTTIGTHANLLKTVSDAIHAFQLDLKTQGLEKRVIGVSLSEFGRQIKSNASDGTDHGTAAPLILFGDCVKPQILGKNPEIGAVVADQEGVAMQHDFRDVYGSILQDWFGADISIVKNVFYTGFKHLELISPACKLTTTPPPGPAPEAFRSTNFKVYPNPATSGSSIEFSLAEEEFIHISLVDVRGNQVKVFASKVMPPGRHKINLDLSSYLPGHYFVRIMSDKNGTQSRSILKL